MVLYRDRRDAGRRLAKLILDYADRPDVIVLGLPRGGVPVAYEVAQALHAPLDVLVVRKLSAPHYAELAIGAVASGGALILNDEVVRALNISRHTIDQLIDREQQALERRERIYRRDRSAPCLRDQVVILIDDGLATGASMQAAVASVRTQWPARIIVAVPIGAPQTCQALAGLVDEIVCAATPQLFQSVSEWYADFAQTGDDEVCRLLDQAAGQTGANQVD